MVPPVDVAGSSGAGSAGRASAARSTGVGGATDRVAGISTGTRSAGKPALLRAKAVPGKSTIANNASGSATTAGILVSDSSTFRDAR